MENGLFNAVSSIEALDLKLTIRDYLEWAEQEDAEILPHDEIGKLEITATEIRWVMLDAIYRQLNDVTPDQIHAAFVSDEAIVEALADSGFCPAFLNQIHQLCLKAVRGWLGSSPNYA
ncbi:hypothetical protein F4695_003815 [Rhizobium soli]|uniref:Uncharacterized protein n=1 Tax=Rhizobium soli TaxID=424798 RepID=A0A7X0JMN6_9HYPH|nr:hypothetical protein [Rhizobium soli]MBB6510426.1 hypothetical protein [Rhizobium soli]